MTTTTLKPTLGTLHLWGIAVGLVISGEYFGWSYGWGVAGTLGFLVTTLMVAAMDDEAEQAGQFCKGIADGSLG